MRQARSFDEVNQVFKQIWDILDQLVTRNIDLKSRRVINASDSLDDTDYTTKREVMALLSRAAQTSDPTELKILTIRLLTVLNGSINMQSSNLHMNGNTLDMTAGGTVNLNGATKTFQNGSLVINSETITVDGASAQSAHTTPIPKLTTLGSNGSITVTNGFVTLLVDPT